MSRRCPNCGGLVGSDAQWCGQCLTRFDRPAPAAPPAADPGPTPAPARRTAPPGTGEGPSRHPEPGPGPIRAGASGIEWECATCGVANPIDATFCRACGTPFARLFEERSARPTVAPGRATALSLAFPGLGHIALGRTAEGVARAVIFTYTLATVVSVVVARGIGDLGPYLPLVVVSAVAGAALYILSTVDAGRVARGEAPVLSTRALLLGAVGLMLLTVALVVVLGSRAGGPG
jgi:hypothetical protein